MYDEVGSCQAHVRVGARLVLVLPLLLPFLFPRVVGFGVAVAFAVPTKARVL
jgi:hypothetical protein